jgi:hypothetical protein
MDLKEYDCVTLIQDLPEFGLKKGTPGTIVIDHMTDPPFFMVEFFDDQHNTIAIESVPVCVLEKR